MDESTMKEQSAVIDFFPMDYSSTVGEEDIGSSISTQPTVSQSSSYPPNHSFEDEPPLWEELGFDPELIHRKSIAMLVKRSELSDVLVQDTDLGGPFVFCLLLGGALVLGGKMHFGYIFGYSFVGSLIMYILLNLMSERGIGFSHTMSVLGYCLAPMIILALTAMIFPPTRLIGLSIAIAVISFCTYRGSYIFTRVLETKDEGLLFAYPIGLLYTCFALIVMF